MNLEEYEKEHFSTYQAYSETVRLILEMAFQASRDLPRPQSIQCRAKEVDSLKRRLDEENKLNSQAIEQDRRDLAGARIIFYTNNDVDRFLASSVISDNFQIEEDSTKVHHPTQENEGTQYRAVHYTVRLGKSRVGLPEYARFASLRCEIQIQTVLNHAWSETSHDVIYKGEVGDGFGRIAMKGITRRFKRIMDDHLLPAGYELQKAQQEYERLLQGKTLFDKGIAKSLDRAEDNNERHRILSQLQDYVIPNYDDPLEAYRELQGPLIRAVKAARDALPIPIETTFGILSGYDAEAVTRLVIEIVESLRYVDIIGTLRLLVDVYRDEPHDDVRQQVLNVVKNLSEYNIDVFNREGPMPQLSLIEYLAGMSDAEVDSIRPIALTVWTEMLQLDITGATLKADSFVFRTGAVPASSELMEVRDKTIAMLFAAYNRSTNDEHRLAVISALDAATRTPSCAQCSNELVAKTLQDAARIVDFMRQRAEATSYELRQHMEHEFLYEYFRATRLSGDSGDRLGCQAEATALVAAIERFRDVVNADDRFVKYKVLVGYESVYPGHWTDEEFVYKGADEYRCREAGRYIGQISAENEDDWFSLIERCAKTKSRDLATFPPFSGFLRELAGCKPEVADKLLGRATADLHRFLSDFLDGLAVSDRNDIYKRVLESELGRGKNLEGLASHVRRSDGKRPGFAARLLARAIESKDSMAVVNCLLFAMEQYGTERIGDSDAFVRDALTFLNDRKDTRWVNEAWFRETTTAFYEGLTPERMSQVLEGLGFLSHVDYRAERILVCLSKHSLKAIWDYFGTRLARGSAEMGDEEYFEPVPFQFHGLERELSKNPELGIEKGLSWFSEDRDRFGFRGVRLMSNAFPKCPAEFATGLADVVRRGGDVEADFALAILLNYQGEASTHGVLKEIVSLYPDDVSKMGRVGMAIDSMGAVHGEYAIADAYRVKREALKEWLEDERPAVREFAEKHIAQLNLSIRAEHARVEAEKEMRKRDFDEEIEDATHEPDCGDEEERPG